MNAASHPIWLPAYIGIGSNLDDPQAQLLRGIDAIAELSEVRFVARSQLYRTAPVGPQDQPDFINAVVGVLTTKDPMTLLVELKALEKELGRVDPVVRWGPRTIDFDLLVVGAHKYSSEQLSLPHPGIAVRAFVLRPLLDIAPDLDVPGVGRVRTLAAQIDMDGAQPL